MIAKFATGTHDAVYWQEFLISSLLDKHPDLLGGRGGGIERPPPMSKPINPFSSASMSTYDLLSYDLSTYGLSTYDLLSNDLFTSDILSYDMSTYDLSTYGLSTYDLPSY